MHSIANKKELFPAPKTSYFSNQQQKRKMKQFFFFFAITLFLPSPDWSLPAIIYSGDITISAYNKSLHLGIENFREKTGIDCIEMEGAINEEEYLQALLYCIEKGYSPIVIPYSMPQSDLIHLLEKNKDTEFVFLDHKHVTLPNVWSFSFVDEEGAFLAGALAALMSKTKSVGFIYTSDVYASMLRFRIGYRRGAIAADPSVRILEGQLGKDLEAWTDIERSRKEAASLINQGVDVLFVVAGYAGTGVFDEAKKKGVYTIGVDTNLNSLYPGTMIGSMVKRSEKMVFIALQLASVGKYRGSSKRVLGLAQDVVGLEFDGVQNGLVPEAVKEQIKKLKAEIIQGKLQVRKRNY